MAYQKGRACGPGHKPEPTNDPFSHVKLGKNHGYLGHFRKEKFIEEGHNTKKKPQGVTSVTDGRAVVSGPRATANVSVDRVRKATAARAIRAGGATGAAVAAERPVLAAKVAARRAGASGAEVRAAARAARKDPNSAVSERKARRSAARMSKAPGLRY